MTKDHDSGNDSGNKAGKDSSQNVGKDVGQVFERGRLESTPGPFEVPGAIIDEIHHPSTLDEVSAIVSEATRTKTGLLLAGGATRLHWANPARDIKACLSLRGIEGVDQFEPEEGVLHAAAGTSIDEIRSLVRREGWELPLDSPGLTSTVGGTVASAVVGPRAHAFGRVSDAILGLDVIGADGIASKTGGRVVKNVTGYDLAKLYCGSFGTLAVMTGAWLRLRPKPALCRVLRAQPVANREQFEMCRTLGRLSSVRALVWYQDPSRTSAEVVFELGGSEVGVDHDQDRIADILEIEEAESSRVDRLRDERAELGTESVALRVRVIGSECEALARSILQLGFRVSIDPTLGVIHARGDLAEPESLREIREQARRHGGLAIFEKLPETWRGALDVFDEGMGVESLMVNLKNRFDPAGILNPGRYLGRL
jgi:glycolate oxidase FAD binding subunit